MVKSFNGNGHMPTEYTSYNTMNILKKTYETSKKKLTNSDKKFIVYSFY